jgi:hypothetical protein
MHFLFFFHFVDVVAEITDFVLYDISDKDVPQSLLSVGENHRSPADCVLDLFEKQ